MALNLTKIKLIGLIFTGLISIACMQPQSSSIQVAGGFDASSSQYDAAQMMIDPSADGRGYCSLGFLNDTTAFSALHCVQRDNGIDYSKVGVRKPNGQIVQVLKIYVDQNASALYKKFTEHDSNRSSLLAQQFRSDPTCQQATPQLVQQLNSVNAQRSQAFESMAGADFAILVFPVGTGDAFVKDGQYFGMSDRTINNGQVMGIKNVGFGNNQAGPQVRLQNTCDTRSGDTGFGTKRSGTNFSVTQTRTLITAVGNANQASGRALTLGGDSGSIWAACYDNACNSLDALAVTSGGGLNPSTGDGTSMGPSLHSSAIKNLIKSAVECTEKPCAEKFRGYDLVILGKQAPASDTAAPSTTTPSKPSADKPTQPDADKTTPTKPDTAPTTPTTPPKGNLNTLDCNNLDSLRNTTGICKNYSSDFCYIYNYGKVEYQYGPVGCQNGTLPNTPAADTSVNNTDLNNSTAIYTSCQESFTVQNNHGVCFQGSSCYVFNYGNIEYSTTVSCSIP